MLLSERLSEDHRRLDALLERALRPDGSIDLEAFASFRAGLLRHIAWEEKLVMPPLRQVERTSELIGRLRHDHSALATLLIPTPRAELIRGIRAILVEHNRLEEEPGGLYEQADATVGAGAGAVLERMSRLQSLAVSPHRDGPQIEARVADVLARVGSSPGAVPTA
ncbi:MAG: hemerythrin domain-containing protein [Myxococcales bacterium]|nr:hemerythrin domain-containing protein [Myxococcales bacterium]